MTCDEVAREVVRLLKEKGLHIVVMESCTGGALTSALTDVTGASEVLKESFVTYSNEAKTDNGVPPALIEQFGVYSHECAKAMAEAAIRCALTSRKQTITIGVTGRLSREDPANPGGFVGEVYACAQDGGGKYRSVNFTVENRDRVLAKQEAVHKALALVLLPFLRGEKYTGWRLEPEKST